MSLKVCLIFCFITVLWSRVSAGTYDFEVAEIIEEQAWNSVTPFTAIGIARMHEEISQLDFDSFKANTTVKVLGFFELQTQGLGLKKFSSVHLKKFSSCGDLKLYEGTVVQRDHQPTISQEAGMSFSAYFRRPGYLELVYRVNVSSTATDNNTRAKCDVGRIEIIF